VPADAVMPSHQWMLRAGMIRPLVSGVYSYLPIGWKVMRKVMRIIREEMDSIGGQELQLPVLNPVEIWDESGRNTDFGDEMFRLQDRKGRTLILAPTHEEVICDLARKYIQSYKDLPQIWYQIQTKFRDEPRPRSGVMRTRQFIMKDSYTLDVDDDGLNAGYQAHAGAYRKIFTRCGLTFHVVGASSGLMGGGRSQEFMVESPYGEDALVLCDHCGKADNLEVASSVPPAAPESSGELVKIKTPGQKTIQEVSGFLKKSPREMMKSLVYASDEPVMILIRGDHEINESKLIKLFGPSVRPAHPDEIIEICGTEAGYVGPIGLKRSITIVADRALENQQNLTTGANEKDRHLSGIDLMRDCPEIRYVDVRNVISGDGCSECGSPVRVFNAVELGHIFKLGTKYSEAMKAMYSDPDGNEKPIFMGSYGIGVERIVAACIEQNFRPERGMLWNRGLAPYLVHLIPVNMDKEEITRLADALYTDLVSGNIDTLLDDRKGSAGFKFKDADLLGMPIHVILGGKWIKEKQIEIKNRHTGEVVLVNRDQFMDTIEKIIDSLS